MTPLDELFSDEVLLEKIRQVTRFVEAYEPKCDMLLVVVRWGGTGGFYGIPLRAKAEVFETLGKERYLRLPKRGTNPRGVEISSEGMEKLLKHRLTKVLEIDWQRPTDLEARELKLAPYMRWLQYWQSD